ncbi:hypothetical protein IV203_028600 [Nitzschia inconspicua]|uniref:Uncharacterized protein n=1 Tax=Nitzschia inconspicua TaxID=303405 RepID=A0A9K3LNY0_9STRA|nr:hypothetical protein IV203_004750 [Nitzschia inconspicua]KAG7365930.1 hypothetical protein IV203_028600 [Nitzschia inconspicua]
MRAKVLPIFLFWSASRQPQTGNAFIHQSSSSTARSKDISRVLKRRGNYNNVAYSPNHPRQKSSAFKLLSGSTIPIDELTCLAYDWCVNLGAPAALVAGAVVATLYENVRGGALDVYQSDSAFSVLAKKLTNILLLSAFGFQIMSIFVTTVTGTLLISRDYVPVIQQLSPRPTSALEFMRQCFEFEYLTARICFLQGLLNWLASVAIEYTIPHKNRGRAGREMDVFFACSLSTLLVLLLAFYNRHLTFYDNYWEMLLRWMCLTRKRFFQPRPLAFIYVPMTILSFVTGIKALWPEKDGNLIDDDDYDGS